MKRAWRKQAWQRRRLTKGQRIATGIACLLMVGTSVVVHIALRYQPSVLVLESIEDALSF